MTYNDHFIIHLLWRGRLKVKVDTYYFPWNFVLYSELSQFFCFLPRDVDRCPLSLTTAS